MLTRIVLQNFQCHRKLDVPLSQITTIVGSSDSGKSAIVRALNYVCLNNLRGNSFITHGQDKCSVSLEVDGQTVRRSRTKTSNSYITETNEYSAVSSEVPPEISKLLNIGEINVSNQHDPLFWFSLTSGQLAKELNVIADIAWVDRVLQVSVSDLRNLNAEIEVTNSRVSVLESEEGQVEWALQADIELQKLEKLEGRCLSFAEAVQSLTEFINRLESTGKEMQQTQIALDDFELVAKAYGRAEGYLQRYDRLENLLSALPTITPQLQLAVKKFDFVHETYTRINSLQQQYERIDSLLKNLPEEIPTSEEIGRLQKKLHNLIDVESTRNQLIEIIEQSENYESQIQNFTLDLHNTQQELHEQCEGRCPICQHPLPS